MNAQIAQELDAFFTQFKRRSYKKGEILVRADDSPPGVFYLTEGIVKAYVISKKGEEITVNMFKPVSFFPMSWAINDTRNEYFYEALTISNVILAPRDKVIDFIKSNPDILYDLMSRVYKGIDGVLTRMTYLMAGNANARLITEVIIAAKRFGVKNNSTIEIQISEKDLASQTGMSRETVSREIKILRDKGLIEFRKHNLLIKDLHLLENELGVEG